MCKHVAKLVVLIAIFVCIGTPIVVEAKERKVITLDRSTEIEDLYPAIDMLKDRQRQLTIDDIMSEDISKQFIPAEAIKQKAGFFETATWLRFEVDNQSEQHEWLLEFSFPLIYEIQIYAEEDDQIVMLHQAGADFPFALREIEHRHFVFDLDIDPGESKTYYAVAAGGGDLHPPINIWDKNRFIEKTQRESVLLGIFYGIILVMILYNLFLFFSLRLKSYLYYVLVISFTLLGKLSINGFGFQYLWPNSPKWNLVSTPFWVALACIWILIFTQNFLNTDRYMPIFKQILYVLILLNGTVILLLPFQHFAALYLMVSASLITFMTVLIAAFICLQRGARQARFYILGWFIFLTGVSITILERLVILPYSIVTEYAGQASLTLEVVLLSLALADKINILRKEKELAERKAQESQALAMHNLQKADELKDEFLAVTSHELRTPLYGMIGIAESLCEGIAGDVSEKMKNQLSMIISSGQRLTQLVDEILDLSKLKYDTLELHLKPVHVKSVVDLIVAISTPLVKQKNLRLVNQINPALPTVRADENRLQQILYNLVDNAIKYTDEGEIVLTAVVEDNHLTINVTDTGQGIAEDQVELIFQPFQQGNTSLSREVSGVGIGLNITKNLVQLHGGSLEVFSKVGEGSTFSVTLPIHDEAEVSQLEEVAVTLESPLNAEPVLPYFPQQTANKNRPKILVADDELINLQVLINLLSLNGYEVLSVSEGEAVFQMIDTHDIDLLILDIMMPGMSGYEVSQRLRTTYSLIELPILMLTAKNQLADKMISFEAGANDYLVKPCDKEELLSRVKTLVRLKKLNQELMQINLHLEEKVAERTHELKVANDNLQDMAKSRRQLLANIAHELGTPITLIQNYIQSVQQGLIALDDLHYRQLVTDKINVLRRLINDLFDLSKLESREISLNLKELPVNEWLEDVYLKSKFIVLGENRKFEHMAIPAAFKQLSCLLDPERIDQLFSNLLSNAIKNTAEKEGKIAMDAQLLAPDRLMIQIHDNGQGISEDDLPFIFERFYQTNTATKEQFGTGLGLAIVKQIVESHQGEIRVESKEQVGTTFYITFPVKAEWAQDW